MSLVSVAEISGITSTVHLQAFYSFFGGSQYQHLWPLTILYTVVWATNKFWLNLFTVLASPVHEKKACRISALTQSTLQDRHPLFSSPPKKPWDKEKLRVEERERVFWCIFCWAGTVAAAAAAAADAVPCPCFRQLSGNDCWKNHHLSPQIGSDWKVLRSPSVAEIEIFVVRFTSSPPLLKESTTTLTLILSPTPHTEDIYSLKDMANRGPAFGLSRECALKVSDL